MDAQLNIDRHVRKIVHMHFDRDGGASYWLEREALLGISARDEIRTLHDLAILGPMDEEALRLRPVMDFVPRSRQHSLAGAVVAETGGTTGKPKRTIFSHSEFRAAFVEPFVRVADGTGFPRGGLWLFAGPGGPHIIGQAAMGCAAALDSPRPFTIDFDPRWVRRLPADSLARERYISHLLEQALDVVCCEPISVIFTTPAILQGLAERMSAAQRRRIQGVHLGGMRVAPGVLKAAQSEWFPDAIHLCGYGNSLFGVCMEFGGSADRELHYHPFGVRHHVGVDDSGRVCMSRLDPTVLIANLQERDVAEAVSAPQPPWADFGPGVADPRTHAALAVTHSVGIY